MSSEFDGLTCTALKRYLKDHKESQTGNKELLRKRCIRHATRCICNNTRKVDTERPETVTARQPIEDIIKTIQWTASLKDFPAIDHACVHGFKASDKHVKSGYNMFKCNKVENMLVGRSDLESTVNFYCQGRVAPAMKSHVYRTLLLIRDKSVIMSDCTCPAGKGKCKHAIALLYALIDNIMSGNDNIPETLACTSLPRQWGKVSARPVVATVTDFTELALQVVCHDPDHPDRATTQAQRVENQIKFSSIPPAAQTLHITRKDILTSNHPFWAAVVREKITPNSTSRVESTPLSRPRTVPATQTNSETISDTIIPPTITAGQESFDQELLDEFDNDLEPFPLTTELIPDITNSTTSQQHNNSNNNNNNTASQEQTLHNRGISSTDQELELDILNEFTHDLEPFPLSTEHVPDITKNTDTTTITSKPTLDIMEAPSTEAKDGDNLLPLTKTHPSHYLDSYSTDPSYERVNLEESTRGQSTNEAWMKARKDRITGSMIGQIHSMRATTVPTKLVAQIKQQTNNDISYLPAVNHGNKFEDTAIKYYENRFDVQVHKRGFMLHPKYDWLGASTDGFINDPPSVVEIKCPMPMSELDMLIDLVPQRKNWFLVVKGGSVCVNKAHKYYKQCQIQMECLDVDQCIFMTYLCDQDGNYIDHYIETIKRDTTLISSLLEKAYSFL